MTKYLKTFSLTVLLLAGCLSLSAQATLQRLEEDITRGGGYITPMNSMKSMM